MFPFSSISFIVHSCFVPHYFLFLIKATIPHNVPTPEPSRKHETDMLLTSQEAMFCPYTCTTASNVVPTLIVPYMECRPIMSMMLFNY
jgi:hypothetical protein